MKFNEFFEIYMACWELKRKGSQETPSETAIKIFYESVKHLEFEVFKNACIKSISQSKWMIDSAEILELAGGSDADKLRQSAENAFNRMFEIAFRQGKMTAEHHEKNTVKALNAINGFNRLPTLLESDTHYFRKEFIEAYERNCRIDDTCLIANNGVKQIGG